MCAGTFVFGQSKDHFDYIAEYQITSRPDSNSKARKSEYMLLLFNNSVSGYRSVTGYLLDSVKNTPDYLMKSPMERMQVMTGYPTHHDEYILIETAKKMVTVTTKANMNPVIHPQYNENVDLQWKLINENKIINKIACSKAEVFAFGRKWVAWYSDQHPVPFGPYKFYGLPGLIVDIRDETESYSFVLNKLRQSPTEYAVENAYDNISVMNKKQVVELVNKAKYTTAGLGSIEGLSEDFLRRSSALRAKRQKENNNPIELTLIP